MYQLSTIRARNTKYFKIFQFSLIDFLDFGLTAMEHRSIALLFNPFFLSFIYLFIHSFIHSFFYSFIFIHSFISSFFPSLITSFICSLRFVIYLITLSFIHLYFIHSCLSSLFSITYPMTNLAHSPILSFFHSFNIFDERLSQEF